MKTHLQIYRYLRYRGKMVDGSYLARAMEIPLAVLCEVMKSVPGTGCFGPIMNRRRSPILDARSQSFCGDFLAFFRHGSKYRCIKDRPLVRAWQRPGHHHHYRYDPDDGIPPRKVSINKRSTMFRKR